MLALTAIDKELGKYSSESRITRGTSHTPSSKDANVCEQRQFPRKEHIFSIPNSQIGV